MYFFRVVKIDASYHYSNPRSQTCYLFLTFNHLYGKAHSRMRGNVYLSFSPIKVRLELPSMCTSSFFMPILSLNNLKKKVKQIFFFWKVPKDDPLIHMAGLHRVRQTPLLFLSEGFHICLWCVFQITNMALESKPMLYELKICLTAHITFSSFIFQHNDCSWCVD